MSKRAIINITGFEDDGPDFTLDVCCYHCGAAVIHRTVNVDTEPAPDGGQMGAKDVEVFMAHECSCQAIAGAAASGVEWPHDGKGWQ